MFGDPARYKAFAERCQRMADAAAREDEKRQWLDMARAWLELAEQVTRLREQNEDEKDL
jgi:hypothetical protein